ncbi:carboxypeptidase-like regulatory domain-containing protein [Psychroserpens ponticola]|uniref:Carboxypeptidase-like regulatory domain-containing protein n=1 Tax=Psychroserpens ponticola TaxID=2932268 RepID=A0ABY7RUW8_9FLAO|nr:carboxypeptidase-like regulatory domain-containing protein [Psychroserpens ponticola]WCO00470.1 carboxypeptidase-like regulatory domain-containing protein [Psychroserpens ponticola]
MTRRVLLYLLLLPISILAQTINGKVYDAETTVKGALVVNVTQNIMTYTNDNGDFKIEAKVKDTLYISSLFHTKTFIKIKKVDFDHVVVIEVKKAINELDAVLLREERERQFDSVKMASQVNSQIKEDIKRNSFKYQPTPSGNMDIIAIIGMVGRLFKSKKPIAEPIIPITYKELSTLFLNDRFFNKDLLVLDLNIPKEYQILFFDYCDAKEIDSKLLAKNKQVDLLEELVICSQEFQKIIEESKKDN